MVSRNKIKSYGSSIIVNTVTGKSFLFPTKIFFLRLSKKALELYLKFAQTQQKVLQQYLQLHSVIY